MQIELKDTTMVEHYERRASTERKPEIKAGIPQKINMDKLRQLSKKNHLRELITKRMADISLLREKRHYFHDHPL